MIVCGWKGSKRGAASPLTNRETVRPQDPDPFLGVISGGSDCCALFWVSEKWVLMEHSGYQICTLGSRRSMAVRTTRARSFPARFALRISISWGFAATSMMSTLWRLRVGYYLLSSLLFLFFSVLELSDLKKDELCAFSL